MMSTMNSTSFASFWSAINQVQLFFLLFLTRAFIPIDIQNVITGGKFSLNIASYIKFPNFIYSAINKFDFNLTNQTLDLLSIKSNSSLFNITPTIILALAVIPIHLLTTLFYYLMPSEAQEGKWKRLKQWITKLMKKLFIMFTFNWYIRYILETNQYVLISCVYEAFV